MEALDQAWRAWAELGEDLDDEQWARPTRLEGWNVEHVYAHYVDAPPVLGATATLPADEAPATFADAESLLTYLQQPGGAAHTAAEHIRDAATTDARPRAELVAQFTDVAPDVIADLRGRDLSRTLDYGGHGTVAAGEALRIALMEAVVHYFDMATALELPKPGPMAGAPLRDTVALLSGIADPVALVEAATGRGQARPFPVLR